MSQEYSIPVLPDDELVRRVHQIRPLCHFGKGMKPIPEDIDFVKGIPHYIRVRGAKNWAFTLHPEPIRKAEGLVIIDKIATYHPFQDARVLHATVEQILSQIPEVLASKAVAFEAYRFGLIADVSTITGEGTHFTTVALYGVDPTYMPDEEAKRLYPFNKCREDLLCVCPECSDIALEATRDTKVGEPNPRPITECTADLPLFSASNSQA